VNACVSDKATSRVLAERAVEEETKTRGDIYFV